MSSARHLARRKFLRGMGVCLVLPVLEWSVPRSLLAAGAPAAATTPSGAPLRMAFCYIPNGVNVESWTPKDEGADYKLSRTLEPLKEFRNDFQVITGLEQRNGFSGKDGAGDHARANSTILTAHVRRRRPAPTFIWESRLTRSPRSTSWKPRGFRRSNFPATVCGSRVPAIPAIRGLSVQYFLATPTSPMAPESNPRLVFERLFGTGEGPERQQAFRQRQLQQRSILDFAADEAQQLNRQLGRNDRHKLDEYLAACETSKSPHRAG